MQLLHIPQGSKCRYHSAGDEKAFFRWLESIPGVVAVRGVGGELEVTLRSRRLSDIALRELIALHLRYRLPMRHLAQFETDRNRAWFRQSGTPWFKAVFGAS